MGDTNKSPRIVARFKDVAPADKASTTTNDNLVRALQARDFDIEVTRATNTNPNLMLVTLGPKLVVKLSIEAKLPLKPPSKYDKKDMLDLCEMGIRILRRIDGFPLEEAWIAHDADDLQRLKSAAAGAEKMALYRDYYGPAVTIYFGFMKFYTQYLLLPTIIGIFLFLQWFFTSAANGALLAAFGVYVTIWASLLMELWKRHNAELNLAWNTHGLEERRAERDIIEHAAERGSDNRAPRLALTTLILTWLLYVVVRLMVYFSNLQKNADSLFSPSDPRRYLPVVMYSMVPVLAQSILDPIAAHMCKFEGYTIQNEAEDALVYKRFAIVFVNRYCGLLYAIFYLQDVQAARTMLISLLTTSAVVANVLAAVTPVVSSAVGRYHAASRKTTTSTATATATTTTTASSNTTAVTEPLIDVLDAAANTNFSPTTTTTTASLQTAAQDLLRMFVTVGSDVMQSVFGMAGIEQNQTVTTDAASPVYDAESLILKELSLPAFDSTADFMKIVTQYGYVVLFASAFPLAPLLALLSNRTFWRLDAAKLATHRRSARNKRSSIGAWQGCFEFLGFAAVLTNGYVLCMLTDHFEPFVPRSFYHSEHGRLLLLVALEHVLIFIKLFVMLSMDDIPMWVKEALARKKCEREDNEALEHKNRLLNLWSSQNADSRLLVRRQAMSNLRHTHGQELAESLAVLKLSSLATNSFGFDPISAVWLVVIPFLLQLNNMSPAIYPMLAVPFLFYMQAKKDRSDRRAAIGIVTEPALMNLILGDEKPGWVTDSEYQRVEWLNTILAKLWSHVSNATEVLALSIVEPLLQANKPAFLSSFELHHIDLGSVSPKITAVKVHSLEENTVKLDLEIKWAGDVEALLKVGVEPLPLEILLADIRLSGTLRVELNNLMSDFPVVGNIDVCFMRSPHVDFSLKVAGTDVMNFLGVGKHFESATHLLKKHPFLDNIIKDTMVYPNKISIPLTADDAKKSIEPFPIGILLVSVHSCRNLDIADLTSSDPYVNLSVGVQQRQTSVKSGTTSPSWNESFKFTLFDRSLDTLHLHVRDYNNYKAHVPLGHITLSTASLKPNHDTEKSLALLGGHGTLSITVCYIPLSQPNDILFDELKDVLDQLPPEAFRDDVISSIIAAAENSSSVHPAVLPGESVSPSTIRSRSTSGVMSDKKAISHSLSVRDRSVSVSASSVPSPNKRRGFLNRLFSHSSHGSAMFGQGISSLHTHSSSDNLAEFPRLSSPQNLQTLGVLSITDIRCEGLKNKREPAASKTKACVKFKHGDNEGTTETVKGQSDPFYAKSIYFCLSDPTDYFLSVSVASLKKASKGSTNEDNVALLFGSLELDLVDVVRMGVHEQMYNMANGVAGECVVAFKMRWQSAHISNDDVTDVL